MHLIQIFHPLQHMQHGHSVPRRILPLSAEQLYEDSTTTKTLPNPTKHQQASWNIPNFKQYKSKKKNLPQAPQPGVKVGPTWSELHLHQSKEGKSALGKVHQPFTIQDLETITRKMKTKAWQLGYRLLQRSSIWRTAQNTGNHQWNIHFRELPENMETSHYGFNYKKRQTCQRSSLIQTNLSPSSSGKDCWRIDPLLLQSLHTTGPDSQYTNRISNWT